MRTRTALALLALSAGTALGQVRGPDLPTIPDKPVKPANAPKPNPARRSPMMIDDMGQELRAEEGRIKDRKELIEIELKHLDRDALKDSDWAKEWAGVYYEGDGLGENVSVCLAPKAGIAFLNYGCLGLYGGDHGEVVGALPDGLRLKLAFGDDRNSFLSERIYFVRWGEERFLVPEWLMPELVNNYNRGGYARTSMHRIPRLIKDGQARRAWTFPPGRPELPPQFAKMLRDQGVSLKVAKVGEPGSRHVTGEVNCRVCTVEFEGGSDQGVYVGEEFHYPKQISLVTGTIRITAVTPATSTGEFTAYYNGNQKVTIPAAGETISTSDDAADKPAVKRVEPAPAEKK